MIEVIARDNGDGASTKDGGLLRALCYEDEIQADKQKPSHAMDGYYSTLHYT